MITCDHVSDVDAVSYLLNHSFPCLLPPQTFILLDDLHQGNLQPHLCVRIHPHHNINLDLALYQTPHTPPPVLKTSAPQDKEMHHALGGGGGGGNKCKHMKEW